MQSDALPHEACPPHLSMIFLFSWKASAYDYDKIAPGFKPTVPIFWS